MKYVFEAPEIPTLPIRGSDQQFPIHRIYCVGRNYAEHAREMGHERGALYSWRTINGDECSPFFPGGSAQYHINADIVYALKTYTEVTNDMDFMVKCGAEMLFETARVWVDVGHYSPMKDNKFCIAK